LLTVGVEGAGELFALLVDCAQAGAAPSKAASVRVLR